MGTCGASRAAADSAIIITPLLAAGDDADARGRLAITLSPTRSALLLTAANLDASAIYTLAVNGEARANATSDAAGRLRIFLANPPAAGKPALQFDPRGKTIEIGRDGVPILAAVVSGSGELPGATVSESALLARESGSARTKAVASYSLKANGSRRLTLTVPALANGTNAEVYVDGIYEGSLRVRARAGFAVFASEQKRASEQLLDFDPRGKVMDVFQAGVLVYSGQCEARGHGVNYDRPEVFSGHIPSTGADDNGTARGRFRIHPDARQTFNLEIEEVLLGSYEVLVDGVLKGAANVASTDAGNEGEIEFATNSDDPEKLPLDFNPLNAVFEVRLGGAVYFQGTLSQGVPNAGSTNAPVELEEYLASTGLQPGASAKAEFETEGAETEFCVRLENAAPGRYALDIGGTRRGYIDVTDPEDGRGELEFTKGGDSGRPLTFEPRGELIEIISSSGTLFSHVFGSGSAGAGGSSAPFSTALPLFRSGAVSGKARMEYDAEDDGERKFEVELENVPAGAYNLLVGGVARGTIQAQTLENSTHGKIEFENDSDDSEGELPLTFDPLGQMIEIEQNGVILFWRELPPL